METEIWKDIKGYEGLYQISNIGRIKGLERRVPTSNRQYSFLHKKEKIIKSVNLRGYLIVSLRKKMLPVHLLVWDHFSDTQRNGRKLVVDHINEDKTDCRFTNLQLLTHRDNIIKHHVHAGKIFTGVAKKRNKWGAWIRVNGKNKYIGLFETPELAHSAYLNEKNKLV